MRAPLASAVAAAALLGGAVESFRPHSISSPTPRPLRPAAGPSFMFFADAAPEPAPAAPVEQESGSGSGSASVRVAPLDGTEPSIGSAARFMVDAFWLQSPQQLVRGDSSDVSESAKSSLVAIQADDLMGKYGERMGRRKLDAMLLAAFDENADGEMLGMVTIEVRLFDKERDILSADRSESMLTQAVAALGPKQRREYKDASVIDVANALLPPGVSAVCSLSNLCVSPSARRRGVAAALCREAERVARDELGFGEMFLRVEEANGAARGLYEGRLGYERVLGIESAAALRVDGAAGSFVEVESDIVLLKKKL